MTDISNPALDTKVTKINPNGRGGWVAVAVATIMAWEGYAAVGHHDRIDPPGINTIGYGHIENVHIGDRVTKIQAAKLLADDLPKYELQVERCIHVPMPGYRHGAIVSFDYNVGGGALCKSSVARYINAGEWEKGCDALLLYDKANGVVIPGLENRRRAERKLCYNQNEPPLPADEVMALPHVNVDQAVADKEAAAIKLPAKAGVGAAKVQATADVTVPAPKPKPAPAPTPVVIAPAPAPVVEPWYIRLGHWFMEK